MKVLSVLLFMLLSIGLFSCEEEANNAPELPLSESITGSWLVVHHTVKESNFSFENKQQGLVTQWGGHYIHSLAINRDGSFSINDTPNNPAYACSHQPIGGSWKLLGKQLVFTWDHAPPTRFDATVTTEGKLKLENHLLELTHTKRP